MARTPIHGSNSDEEILERLAAPLRDAYVRQPEPETEHRHVAAMAAASRQAPPTAAAAPAAGALGRLRSRLTPAGRPGGKKLVPAAASTLAACVAFSGVSAGLAAAGVSLPDPVRAPFNAVGVTLPNQADDAAREALEMPKPRGPESEAERARPSQDARRAERDAQRRSVDPPGSRETGRERSQPGRDTARERSQQGGSGAPVPGARQQEAPRGAPQEAPRGAPQGAPRGGPQGPPGGAVPQEGERPEPPRRPVTPQEQPVAPQQGPRENGPRQGLEPGIAPTIPDLGSG